MRLLLVNTVAQGGSIPAYMRDIAAEAAARGWTVAVACARHTAMPGVENIHIGSKTDWALHGLATRLLDRHGLHSRRATERFISQAQAFGPDIIHLHNIHGYYLHFPTLFAWLREWGRPVFWSLHDSWAYTGHCAFYTSRGVDCRRWQQGCGHCPLLKLYPASLWRDRSRRNLVEKARIFNELPTLTLLPVSQWLCDELAQSALSGIRRELVRIDVNLKQYRPCATPGRKRVLGAAANWNPLKGADFFVRLRRELPPDVEIRLLGSFQGKAPEGISMPGHCADPERLAHEYSEASLFVNPTYADNYPMVNREALACGTPLLTRRRGGSVEDLEGRGLPVMVADTDDELVGQARQFIAGLKPGNSLSVSASAARKRMEELFGGRPGMRRLFELYCENTNF